MATFLAILKLLPAIIAAIRSLEEFIPISQAGKSKLDIILDTMKEAGAEVAGLVPMVISLINRLVGLANKTGVFSTTPTGTNVPVPTPVNIGGTPV